jgi:uncharacterized protein (DUF1810 family)
MADEFNLERFVEAQEPVYDSVLEELRRGQKRRHWMWFIFPQIKGLGQSPTAVRYSVASRDEAHAYLAHPVLGSRLRECTQLVVKVEGASAKQIFGYPDFLKFRSCMTLFHAIRDGEALFQNALEKYFNGKRDKRTLDILAGL